MKTKLFFTALFISFIFLNIIPACQNREKIALKDLPVAAQTFIGNYFSLDSITSITTETQSKTYDVTFLNRGKILFNQQGIWQEIDVERSPFPIVLFDILPAKIFSYLIATYPTEAVKALRRTSYGYEIEIGSSPKKMIQFDNQGVVMKKNRRV